jgi:glutamate-1-semialdehyde 2,1-aminomutase
MALDADDRLRKRALSVIPNGMYGHQSVGSLPPGTPQFFARAKGPTLWDHDGNEYLDFMCGYGPQLFGYGHESIDAAYVAQLAEIDTATGPSGLIVDLAEAFVAMISHADWALFCKNGTDATSMALMTARVATGRKKILKAKGAYHGIAPWCTPIPAGTVEEDRSNTIEYVYNDVASLEVAVTTAGDDLAGIFASPFKHDVVVDQELPDPLYARRARELCDERGAFLIVDDIRAGFRLARDCSWQSLGVEPDLSCWGKAIANGHAISALLGSEGAREAASRIYATGSFWFSSAPMAASLATLRLIRESDYLERTVSLGEALRSGLEEAAAQHGLPIKQTGPVQMPLVTFSKAPSIEDSAQGKDGLAGPDLALGSDFCAGMIERGIYFHPWHNMFISAAMTPGDIARTVERAAEVMSTLPTTD